MVDMQSTAAEIRRKKKKEEEEETTGQKYNGLPYSIGYHKKLKNTKKKSWSHRPLCYLFKVSISDLLFNRPRVNYVHA